MVFKKVYFVCIHCGHKNSPHQSPRKSYRLVIANPRIQCSACRRDFQADLEDLYRKSPLACRIREELEGEQHALSQSTTRENSTPG